ncbi:type V CRISPR-associated protein Cas4 [Candidatus Roizmanbacteria bacterium]|nr:type V CRISPR-associated protein Cas4 [Candidatus Roizmanbacteria bacterium]
MESAIPISTINDFLYCPKSLYLHGIYSAFDTSVYHDTPQIKGSIIHENIEEGRYSTSKYMLQALSIYSVRLGLKGKIDVYDSKKHELIERKYRVKQLYKGFIFQLYAQMYCMQEMGYVVDNLYIQSLSDNKRYQIDLPSEEQREEFEKTIQQMKSFGSEDLIMHTCNHCNNNIYDLLNW